MKKLILFLITIHVAAFAEKNEIFEGSLFKEKTDKIYDKQENFYLTSTSFKLTPKVNPITGEYCEEETDIIVAGQQPISLRRFYNHTAPQDPRYARWRYNPECFFIGNLEWREKEKFAAIGENDGSIHSYYSSEQATFTFKSLKDHISTSGQNHPLNTKIQYTKVIDPRDDKRFQFKGKIVDGRGNERSFITPMHRWHENTGPKLFLRKGYKDCYTRISPNVWTPYHLPISEEKLPNGNIICYGYSTWLDIFEIPHPELLTSITAYNATKTKILGQITLQYTQAKDHIMKHIVATGSDNRKVSLINQIREIQPKNEKKEEYQIRDGVLKDVITPNKPAQNYLYRWDHKNTYFNSPFLIQACTGRSTLHTDYDLNEKKVLSQSAPVGANGEIFPIARYEYHDRATIVRDGEDNLTIYRYDANKRITSLEHYNNGVLYSIERFNLSEKGNLEKKTIEDASGQLIQSTEYEYDDNHNPIKETVGDGKQSTTITRTFSKNGFNLLETETYPNGKKVVHNYVPDTNLVSSEFIYDHKKICKRKFNFYHEELQAFCVKTIIDDGTTEDPNNLKNVICRKIIEYKPKLELPCIGLPEEIIEKTIDNSGNEILLKRIRYTYHPSGKIEKEEHYDANNEYCFTLTNEYDAQERLITTIDALGHRTEFGYDQNFNLISQKGEGLHKEWSYDLVNRPIKIVDGDAVSKNIYDRASRLTAVVDPSGFTTSYEYDSLGRVIIIHHPDGAIERKEYDIPGNVTKEIDANGYETTKTYNFKGQVLSVNYPDGSKETSTYDIDTGNLTTHVDKNGTKTVYTYDVFDNPVKTEVYSPKGKSLKKTSAIYSAFNKLSETDAEGVTTVYTYDFSGRKTEEKTLDRVIEYSYDSLGRQSCTKQGETLTIYLYDLKDQLIEKRIEDLQGNLYFQEKYDYDQQGKLIETLTCEGVTKTFYNSSGQPIKQIDAIGNETEIFYSYEPSFTKTTRDPKGVVTIEKHDSRTRLQEVEVKDVQGKTIQKREKLYDLASNQTHATEHIYQGTQLLKTITNEWSYGPNNRVERLLESGRKETNYLYDSTGRLKTTIKPDGTKLEREYDDLGRLKRYHSDDFDYNYTYDKNNNILKIYDATSGSTTYRSYDSYGNVTREDLANGITLYNTFDPFGKRTLLTFSDGSKIYYSYKGDYLDAVTRNKYSYTYKRNLSGKPIHLELPNNLGEIDITYDAALRWKQYRSPYFNADYTYDPVGNLILYQFEDPLGKEKCSYAYDSLNQLITENDHQYTYDSLYNRTAKNKDLYELNDLSQILNDGNLDYQYDPNGNLISDGKQSYKYDSLDRLITVSENSWLGSTTKYTYDPFNRRLTKNSDSYIWDGKNEIGISGQYWGIRDLRVLGEGFGAEIGAAVIFELNGYTYFPIHDHRGSLITMITPDGKTYDTCRYTAFGEELTKPSYSPWRFASKRFDPETGFVYFGRRYYNPTLGRWITADPQGFEDGPNLYAYVHNSPMMDIDLYGLFALSSPTFRDPSYGIKIGTGFFKAAWGHMQGMGSSIGSYGEWKNAINQYQYFDNRSFFDDKSARSKIEFDGMTSTFKQRPFGATGDMFIPGVMEFSRKPSLENLGRAGFDVLTLGTLFFKGSQAARLRTTAGRAGEEISSLGKIGRGIEKVNFGLKEISNPTLNITPKNFFGTKTYMEMDKLFTNKFGSPRGVGLYNKSYYNSKTGRTFNLHWDPLHREGKPHIDIRKRGLDNNYYKDNPFFLLEE